MKQVEVFCRAGAASSAFALLAACAAGTGMNGTLAPASESRPLPGPLREPHGLNAGPVRPGWKSDAAKTGKNLLYVSENAYQISSSPNGTIEIYKRNGSKPIGEITSLVFPAGMAVDRSLNLYVAIGTGVAVIPPGKTSPSFTYPAYDTTNVALDYSGHVYVLNQTTAGTGHNLIGPGNVVVYKRNSTTPLETLQPWPNEFCAGIAVDSKKNLFVSCQSVGTPSSPQDVQEFPAGSTTPVDTGIFFCGGFPGGLAIDSHDNLLVGCQDPPAVSVYPLGRNGSYGMQPTVTFAQSGSVYFFSLSRNNRRVYVANRGQGNVGVYDYPLGNSIRTVTNGLAEDKAVTGTALSPASRY